MPSLKATYDQYFDVWPVGRDDLLLNQVFRLRYQVYCLENAFEPIENNPNELEKDPYDDHSLHALLVYRKATPPTPVGTVRLILPFHEGKPVVLPIRRLFTADRWAEIGSRVPLDRTAEISRFAVSKEFRRRPEDRGSMVGGLYEGPDPRRVVPQISLGLMRAICMMAAAGSITHLFAVMEPILLRMLERLGIHFDKIGPLVSYHGPRQPCSCDLARLLERTARERPDVWDVITDSGQLSPHDAEPTIQRDAQPA